VDQLYASYAQGKDSRALASIVGEEALSGTDKKFLRIASIFERNFVNQGFEEDRSIEQTLDIGWEVLDELSESEIKRIRPEFIAKYRNRPSTRGNKVA
jgi:V/A-type H+-transporting ATPase subunit B